MCFFCYIGCYLKVLQTLPDFLFAIFSTFVRDLLQHSNAYVLTLKRKLVATTAIEKLALLTATARLQDPRTKRIESKLTKLKELVNK